MCRTPPYPPFFWRWLCDTLHIDLNKNRQVGPFRQTTCFDEKRKWAAQRLRSSIYLHLCQLPDIQHHTKDKLPLVKWSENAYALYSWSSKSASWATAPIHSRVIKNGGYMAMYPRWTRKFIAYVMRPSCNCTSWPWRKNERPPATLVAAWNFRQ